jgi:hypothetical protein
MIPLKRPIMFLGRLKPAREHEETCNLDRREILLVYYIGGSRDETDPQSRDKISVSLLDIQRWRRLPRNHWSRMARHLPPLAGARAIAGKNPSDRRCRPLPATAKAPPR